MFGDHMCDLKYIDSDISDHSYLKAQTALNQCRELTDGDRPCTQRERELSGLPAASCPQCLPVLQDSSVLRDNSNDLCPVSVSLAQPGGCAGMNFPKVNHVLR